MSQGRFGAYGEQAGPLVGPFRDLHQHQTWPFVLPRDAREFPPAEAGVAAYVTPNWSGVLGWYGWFFGCMLAVALRGFLPRACMCLLRLVHPLRDSGTRSGDKPKDDSENVPVSAVLASTLVARVHERVSTLFAGPPDGLVKAFEIAKTLPLLFLVLQPTFLLSYVCETPAVLATLNGFGPWGHTPIALEVPLNNAHLLRQGMSDPQAMAIWVMTMAMPSAPYFIGLISLELASVLFHFVNMDELAQRGFRFKGFFASLLLGFVWASYEAQTMAVIRLWNSPYDAADMTANMLNATFPQRWSDPAGPENLWCSIPSGSNLVRLIASGHFLCMLPFIASFTPPVGTIAARALPAVRVVARCVSEPSVLATGPPVAADVSAIRLDQPAVATHEPVEDSAAPMEAAVGAASSSASAPRYTISVDG
jgi:hypothetical protein